MCDNYDERRHLLRRPGRRLLGGARALLRLRLGRVDGAHRRDQVGLGLLSALLELRRPVHRLSRKDKDILDGRPR